MQSSDRKTTKSAVPSRGRFIQPGKLASNNRVLKAFKHRAENDGTTARNHGNVGNSIEGNHDGSGLMVHFGDLQYHDKDFDENYSFLDILGMSKHFVDIYSVGLSFGDKDGRPIKNDADVVKLFTNYSPTIHVYAKKDISSQGLLYKLPSDNPDLASYTAPKPRVTNIKLVGELKVNKKVMVCGDIIDGMESASIAEFFLSIDKNLDVDNGLVSISLASKEKEFELPLIAVGHFVVAKLTPMTEDGKFGDPKYAISKTFVKGNSDIPKKTRQVRGCNKNKKVSSLKQGEKLDIEFYYNRAVDKNQGYFARHLGKIVRDRNICPIRVKSWTNITDLQKKHMWDSVIEYFKHNDMESYYEHTLNHMRELWVNCRSDLYRKHVKGTSKLEALKKVPKRVDSKDWEWLVNNHFYTPEFQAISARNSKNRAAQTNMVHCLGSKPHREVIYQMGGKEGNPPGVGEIFLKTRKVDGKTVAPETLEKYDEITRTMESEPSLTNLQVVEKCFGPQRHGNVFGYGGGIKRKHFEHISENEELKAKLRDKESENRVLLDRLDRLENRVDQVENERGERSNTNTSSSNDEIHE